MKTTTWLLCWPGNTYPGRGIVLGKTADGKQCCRRLLHHGPQRQQPQPGVRARSLTASAPRPLTPRSWTDPSLIIYHPVRQLGRDLIVTNGDQTDTIRDSSGTGRVLRAGACAPVTFEPDGPNWTPRISGLLAPPMAAISMSILKSADVEGSACAAVYLRVSRP